MSGSSGSYVQGLAPTTDRNIARWSGSLGSVLQGSNLTLQNVGGFAPTQFGTGSVAVGTSDVSSSLVIYSNVVSDPLSCSIYNVANVNKDTIDANHTITRFGWENTTQTLSSSWNVKAFSFESAYSASAEMLGTSPDGASSIGCIVGSSASYVTAGAKLFSVQNAGVERASIDYLGNRTFGVSDYGSSYSDLYWVELVSISGSVNGIYSTTNYVPAGASIWGVNTRTRATFPTASVFACGLTGSWNDWGWGISGVAGATNATSSMMAGWKFCGANTNIYLSSSVMQSNAAVSGSVRVECRYRVLNPLLS
jgi:hypothetical protein